MLSKLVSIGCSTNINSSSKFTIEKNITKLFLVMAVWGKGTSCPHRELEAGAWERTQTNENRELVIEFEVETLFMTVCVNVLTRLKESYTFISSSIRYCSSTTTLEKLVLRFRAQSSQCTTYVFRLLLSLVTNSRLNTSTCITANKALNTCTFQRNICHDIVARCSAEDQRYFNTKYIVGLCPYNGKYMMKEFHFPTALMGPQIPVTKATLLTSPYIHIITFVLVTLFWVLFYRALKMYWVLSK